MGTLTLVVSGSTFGFGAYLVIHHDFKLGTLIALSALLGRLIGLVQSIGRPASQRF